MSSILLLCAGCGNSESVHEIKQGDLVGLWKDSTGNSIRFYGDHELKVSGISAFRSEGSGCTGRGVGQWSFYFETGDSVGTLMTSDEASEGSLISITLPESGEGECDVDLSVIDEGRSLCIADLDQVCSSDLRFTRQ
ncbi:hypothetical protein G3I47_14920 [Streptomyces anulatus]|uniref:hypothetical protein n=1 Tax=Streptomyces anulatus TaxID=1892 RepID=UPI0013BA172F|nr:hypothetical protein [Streptomyces anulatus]NDZ58547.1 hypothetical protein [Streptomyces anulatus]